MAGKKKSGLWHFVDNLEGDKVVWMIVLLLILISIVAIFSSTPLLANQTGSNRIAIVRTHLIITCIGLAVIIVCYNIKSIRFFRLCSQLGFIISLGILLFLDLGINLGAVKAASLNNAQRFIIAFGFQINVYEVVKVAMVMYLAWAVNEYKNGAFKMSAKITAFMHRVFPKRKLGFFDKDAWTKLFYIYGPMLLICVLCLPGSNSSALFIGAIMFATIIISGFSIKELILPGLAAVLLLAGCIGIYHISDGQVFTRIGTAVSRMGGTSRDMQTMLEYKDDRSAEGREKYNKAKDNIVQPIGALVAVQEGGLIGKGAGASTQKYKVPVMYGDYMFSFIVEEYGLIGGMIVIILYMSLLARGSMIVRNCENLFAQTAVAGLVLLISGQAFMHMFINLGIGPLTGQTLPMVSHGSFSFIMFSLAFGIILSISRMAKKKMDREEKEAKPLLEATGQDNVKSTLNELDSFEDLGKMEDPVIMEEEIEEQAWPLHENDIMDYDMDDHNNL